MPTPLLEDFPFRAFDKIRYADTDRQGHVNNAVFSTYLETGRVEFLYDANMSVLSEGANFVIASLSLDFISELKWPGRVDIGTGILSIGNSSLRLYQRIFQQDTLVASAETVIVQVDAASGRGKALSDAAREALSHYLLPKP